MPNRYLDCAQVPSPQTSKFTVPASLQGGTRLLAAAGLKCTAQRYHQHHSLNSSATQFEPRVAAHHLPLENMPFITCPANLQYHN